MRKRGIIRDKGSRFGMAHQATKTAPDEKQSIRDLARRVFENAKVAERWLEQPNVATNNDSPANLLATPEGREQVKNLLLRIEYGVLA
jgi:putative toxin-antitoxin system antitoxin component (TIGR02293 family)